jgi:hypothetical protein
MYQKQSEREKIKQERKQVNEFQNQYMNPRPARIHLGRVFQNANIKNSSMFVPYVQRFLSYFLVHLSVMSLCHFFLFVDTRDQSLTVCMKLALFCTEYFVRVKKWQCISSRTVANSPQKATKSILSGNGCSASAEDGWWEPGCRGLGFDSPLCDDCDVFSCRNLSCWDSYRLSRSSRSRCSEKRACEQASCPS